MKGTIRGNRLPKGTQMRKRLGTAGIGYEPFVRQTAEWLEFAVHYLKRFSYFSEVQCITEYQDPTLDGAEWCFALHSFSGFNDRKLDSSTVERSSGRCQVRGWRVDGMDNQIYGCARAKHAPFLSNKYSNLKEWRIGKSQEAYFSTLYSRRAATTTWTCVVICFVCLFSERRGNSLQSSAVGWVQISVNEFC
jgi:hypothetical protein